MLTFATKNDLRKWTKGGCSFLLFVCAVLIDSEAESELSYPAIGVTRLVMIMMPVSEAGAGPGVAVVFSPASHWKWYKSVLI